MKLSNLTVLVPAYNEEKTIGKVIQLLLSEEFGEIIVVDDGSKDKTVGEVKKITSKRIKLIIHKKNKGKGAAIITGIRYATKKYLIIQDADLELNPKDIAKLYNKVNENNFVIGNRWGNYHKYTPTRLGNHLILLTVLLLYGKLIYDPYCCYKLASTEKWKDLKLQSPKFEIEAEIVGKILKNTNEINQVTVRYKPRNYNAGKKIRLNDLFEGLKKILLVRFS